MKSLSFYGLLAGALMATEVLAFSSPTTFVFEQKPSTASSARFLDIETPFRCSVKSFGDQEVSTTIALKKGDFQLTLFDTLDALPRFEVNGYSFERKPVDEALQTLLDEAQITVYTEDEIYPALDAEDVYGELSEVVAKLAEEGGVFYQYDAARKELYLSSKGRFEVQLPDNRMVMLAILDALRGAGIYNITPDWKKSTLLLTVTKEEKEYVQSLLNHIVRDSYLMLADTHVYQLTPKTPNANWQSIVSSFGLNKVYSATNGITGKLMTTGHHQKSAHLINALKESFSVLPLSQGIAIVPNGWKTRFDIGQCSVIPSYTNDLSVLLNARIKSPEDVTTQVTLDTKNGEISTFNTVGAIDNEMIVFGIPMDTVTDIHELMMTLKIRLIRLVKEN